MRRGIRNELHRRTPVLRCHAHAGLVGACLVVLVSSTLLPMFNTPVWSLRSIVIVLTSGFIPR